jgi:hypothetical protein
MKTFMKRFSMESARVSYRWLGNALMVAVFIPVYFVGLRYIRVMLVSGVILPAAVSLDAGPESGLLVYHEAGSTGIYVYRLDAMGVVAGDWFDGSAGDSELPATFLMPDSSQVPGKDGEGHDSGHVKPSEGSNSPGDSLKTEASESIASISETQGPEPLLLSPQSQGPVSMRSAGGKPYYLFKGFGDQFFLFGGVLLLLMGQWRHVGWLYLFHAGVSVLNVGLLLVGVTGAEIALQFMDFLIEYLIPATSMLWVVALYGTRKSAR